MPIPNLQIHYGGVALQAQKLQDYRDDVSDIKIALLNCQETFQNIGMRQNQWSRITNNKGSGTVAVEALAFHARCLADLDETERREDKLHSTMPEMSTVLMQIEQAKEDRALRQQALQVQQQWMQTSGRFDAAPIGQSGGPTQTTASLQQMVNPYSVVPSQRAMGPQAASRVTPVAAAASPRPPVYQQPQASPYPYNASAPPAYSPTPQQPAPQLHQQQQRPMQPQQQQRPQMPTYSGTVNYPVNTTMYNPAPAQQQPYQPAPYQQQQQQGYGYSPVPQQQSPQPPYPQYPAARFQAL